MQLWDIGGQSIGSKMLTNYIAGAHAVIFCYDITNYESFANLEDWYRIVNKAFIDRNKQLPYFALVANKQDLRHLTCVRPEQHNAFCDENKCASFLISAKNGDQVMSTFLKIASELCGKALDSNYIEGTAAVSSIPATIIDHERHDKGTNNGKMPEKVKQTNSSNGMCTVS